MSASESLQGLTLASGWVVTEHLSRNPNGSGGTFSQSYKVEKEGRVGFLKAFDFWEAFEAEANTTELLQILTAAYNFEREILDHCKDRRLSNVVLAVDHGQIQVAGFGIMDGRVFYLVFEMAESDLRCQIDETKRFDVQWCMHALRDVILIVPDEVRRLRLRGTDVDARAAVGRFR
jgi:hypothetical protein